MTNAETAGEKLAFTVREFCEAYGISKFTAYGEIGAGRLKTKKVGRRTLVLRSDADAWANALPDGKEAA